jgi:transposase
MAIQVRALTEGEAAAIGRLTRSRTAPARAVERAKIIALSADGRRAPAIARELGLGGICVRQWLKRFNERGLDGLADAPRSGRPATYGPEQVGEVIAASLTKPQELGLPFASWTLDRLEVYLNEQKGIAIKRSRIDDVLLAEGLRWRQQEAWFGERAALDRQGEDGDVGAPQRPVDPAFAQKRGPSRPSTRRHLTVVS